MSNFDPAETNPEHRQIGAMFGAVGRVIKDPNMPGPGFFYPESSAKPIVHQTRRLQTEHGLNITQVFTRLMIASELAVAVREHVEPQLSDGPPQRLN